MDRAVQGGSARRRDVTVTVPLERHTGHEAPPLAGRALEAWGVADRHPGTSPPDSARRFPRRRLPQRRPATRAWSGRRPAREPNSVPTSLASGGLPCAPAAWVSPDGDRSVSCLITSRSAVRTGTAR